MNKGEEVSNITNHSIRIDASNWKEPAHFDIEANTLLEALTQVVGVIKEEALAPVGDKDGYWLNIKVRV